ncbi:hypothetical protein LTR78_004297 [Recurvomyces mirabilis]|uniref:DUF726-domain-containing protein n=1 Tax=Recurvomyces mirabilis TaxID=574656 RepID=A0AAE1C2I6_9PEZI|nr:hypothetical protein LTR78_004297 [Recurvomyces mirabilis]KAK5156036.1 hypothetical protein LTS14_005602 [Recurvomyces mirabilis]
MAASSADETAAATKHEAEDDGGDLPQLKPAVTREQRHHDAKGEPPEADDFGLPVRKPRRRTYDLDELASPELARGEVQVESNETKGAEEGPGGEAKSRPEADATSEADEKAEELSRPPESSASTAADAEPEPGHEAVEASSAKSADREESVEQPRASREGRKSVSSPISPSHGKQKSLGTTSEFSHQQLTNNADEEEEETELKWQEMPALAEHRIYDDWGKVLAKSYDEVESNAYAYGDLGGAGKGYTRVQIDEDAQSATSMDESTAYLFKEQYARNALDEEDDEGRDIASQMNTTKELLTEGQRIAYVGVVRLAINRMAHDLEALEKTKNTRKVIELSSEALRMWGQKMMVRLYTHMEIDQAEQVMVEQLADHGVLPSDLTPALMQNARVKNPKVASETSSIASARPSLPSPRPSSTLSKSASNVALSVPGTPGIPESDAPPAYEEKTADDLRLQDASELQGKSIDLDLRWTVLCDLFLLLIADSNYDSRSRTLLERVGEALSMEWQEICRFEKRVTDALEMQEQAEKENWNEEEHMKEREKRARKKRMMVMGLCTVGGGLIIGLSAGALAPVIGAGLAAGFTGIGVAGTGTFLGGTGAAALIGTTGTLIGGRIGLKGASRRTGAVKTFEYKPLFNNKRVNLIVTVAGWMTGKVDDVRLPFSTVDPVMGDIYSVNWEPEMLQSTGETIQILGTEALTQTIQQILGATFLATLMAGLSLPIVLTKLAYLIDNPWTVSLARADSTGLILADSLIDRNLGSRPITLVGFSLGSRVIFSCLRELARRGALGLIQNVYMFGSPVVVKKDEWIRARTVVSGRFVNAYARNDWILAYLFRATSGGVMRVAGLNTVEDVGVENIDVTVTVPGHMAYRGMMPTLLHEVGWEVESEEFTEIEDPDPENHDKRQRELLNEIEEARQKLEEQPEKKGFRAFFSRKKASERKAWETYDERSTKVLQGDQAESEKLAAEQANVMFDVDAIRREALQLALEGHDVNEIKSHMQIKEIASTLPALRIESPTPSAKASNPVDGAEALKRTRTPDGQTNGTTLTNGHTNTNVNGDDDDEKHDDKGEEITMSFDPPEKTTAPVPTPRTQPPAWLDEHSGTASTATSSSHDLSKTAVERPTLQSRNTTPAPSTSTSISTPSHEQKPANGAPPAPAAGSGTSRNPWADEEDDLGVRRKSEVEMSFE